MKTYKYFRNTILLFCLSVIYSQEIITVEGTVIFSPNLMECNCNQFILEPDDGYPEIALGTDVTGMVIAQQYLGQHLQITGEEGFWGCIDLDFNLCNEQYAMTLDEILIMGCTDPPALNYDPNASIDDGSCEYEDVSLTLDPDHNNTVQFAYFIESDSSISTVMTHEYFPDGMPIGVEGMGVAAQYIDDVGWVGNLINFTTEYNYFITVSNPLTYIYPGARLHGCTDPPALNYNPEATIDDGSCEYEENLIIISWPDFIQFEYFIQGESGFESVVSSEYFPNGMPDFISGPSWFGSYIEGFGWFGATGSFTIGDNYQFHPSGITYNYPGARLMGCTDPFAANYNPDATLDDGSCDYGSIQFVEINPDVIYIQELGLLDFSTVTAFVNDNIGDPISDGYLVKFAFIPPFPPGVHFNDQEGLTTFVTQTLDGFADVTIYSGSTPGTVNLSAQVFAQDDIDFTNPLYNIEEIVVTIHTGPPAFGDFTLSYIDVAAISGGMYELPLSVYFLDLEGNPILDISELSLAVYNCANPFNSGNSYYEGDEVMWGTTAIDSLVYVCLSDTLIPPIPEPSDTVLWGFPESAALISNENINDDQWPGIAFSYLFFPFTSIFEEVIVKAIIPDGFGDFLIADIRDTINGQCLMLPYHPGEISLNADIDHHDFSVGPNETNPCRTPIVTITANLEDWYGENIDNGVLQLSAVGGVLLEESPNNDPDWIPTVVQTTDSDGFARWYIDYSIALCPSSNPGECQQDIDDCELCEYDDFISQVWVDLLYPQQTQSNQFEITLTRSGGECDDCPSETLTEGIQLWLESELMDDEIWHNVSYTSEVPFSAWQFVINGASNMNLMGGAPGLFQMLASDSISVGLSLTGSEFPAGEGQLFSFYSDSEPTGFSSIIFSDNLGNSIPTMTVCEDDEFQCGNSECIGIDLLCNGTDDCGDYYDEYACFNNIIWEECGNYQLTHLLTMIDLIMDPAGYGYVCDNNAFNDDEIVNILDVMLTISEILEPEPEYNGPVWHISTDGSDESGDGSSDLPFASIQLGIDSTVDGDTVLVYPGTYLENIDFDSQNIVIGSLFITTGDTSYISQTVIDGNQSGTVVTFDQDETESAALIGLTIQNGLAIRGGGVYCDEASPTLSNLIVINNFAEWYGGGIHCRDNSFPLLTQVQIMGNSAIQGGGGIYSWESGPILTQVTVSGNTVIDQGGGIYSFGYSTMSLTNVTISGNSATGEEGDGGGIYFANSAPSLTDVTIARNQANRYGGGIYAFNTFDLGFSAENRCNIYSNTVHTRGSGADIFTTTENIAVVVDTFSVMIPTDYHASPINEFTFDIWHAVQQQVDADLYVSPNGDDGNDGLTPETPFMTIHHALETIHADSLQQHTIYLADGLYSSSSNGEIFPVEMVEFVSLNGASESTVILDAEQSDVTMIIDHVNHCSVSNLTLTGGLNIEGGGIYCRMSSPVLSDITITGNAAIGEYGRGGGIFCIYSELDMTGVAIINNSAATEGGAVYCDGSDMSMVNMTISGNTAITDGGGIYAYDISNINVTNSILWNNFPTEVSFYEYYPENFISLAYSNVQGGESGIETHNNGEVLWLEGNLNLNPQFVDPETGDFHLETSSPCIDAGDPYAPLDPDGTNADMGAYYYHQTEFDCGYGDYNNDGGFDILDIVALVTQILSFETPTELELACGDLNGDGNIDIDDYPCISGFPEFDENSDLSTRELIEFTVIDTIAYSSNNEFVIPIDITVPSGSYLEAFGFDLVFPELSAFDSVYVNEGLPQEEGFLVSIDHQNNRIRTISFTFVYTAIDDYIGRLFDVHFTATAQLQTTPVLIENIHVNGGCTYGHTAVGNDGMLGVIDSTRTVYLEPAIMGEEYSEIVEFPFEPEEGFFEFISVPDWLNIDAGFENSYQLTITGIPPVNESNYTEEIVITYPDDGWYWVLILPIIETADVTLYFGDLNLENNTIELWMDNLVNVAAVNLHFVGFEIEGLSGGTAQEYGFFYSESIPNGFTLFSMFQEVIPPGNALLTNLDFSELTGEDICITESSAFTITGDALTVTIGDCITFDLEYFTDILNGQLEDYLNFADTTGLTVESTISIDFIEDADIGDEIGLLDYNGILNFGDCSDELGEILVGAGVWQGEPLEITTYGSMDFCDDEENEYGQYPGWIEGNNIEVLFWRSSEDQVYEGYYNMDSGILTWAPDDQFIPQLIPVSQTTYDVNGDNAADVLDVVLMVGYILGNVELNQGQRISADTNSDGFVDVLDIVTIVDYILED
ncbi:MAG: DUF1565 domain-containing protein [Candidatus Marinimicrobia bacterium]|jgi:predicted outer membrane repeat protein|nr:DUF1565 domain-containing protein [Candidatus Neomarinimicrobiota bacterium]MBT3632933.1 DUF1565 domain-containing protein [Candidatus Neomarinimicrobiota bacterium]MBT3682043.1 DUF1565 domain-containing protein [Candidatus Neomarinimicrobiota bacterium]MBT3758928.1 DUF1565 domain-containing protein [Candidatus Neomarinimicrobiota bacterium]MBT3895173.1 DUF1565 domain-containing protein [Candidatus Neomarinimicrobiota bacterium]